MFASISVLGVNLRRKGTVHMYMWTLAGHDDVYFLGRIGKYSHEVGKVEIEH